MLYLHSNMPNAYQRCASKIIFLAIIFITFSYEEITFAVLYSLLLTHISQSWFKLDHINVQFALLLFSQSNFGNTS